MYTLPLIACKYGWSLTQMVLSCSVNCLVCTYLMVVLIVDHLNIHPHKLTQMSVSVGVLSTEYWRGRRRREGGGDEDIR